MKIVIPIAGKGQRFKDAGFIGPKPLLYVSGKQMLEWAVESVKKTTNAKNSDFIFVSLLEHDKEYDIGRKLQIIVPGSKTLFIKNVTRGAAETVFLTRNLIDRDEELFITDCDQYFIFHKFLNARKRALKNNYAGIIGTMNANSPAYSYAQVDLKGFVKRTAEKEVISKHAAIGVYYFTKSKFFMDSIEFMIKNKQLSKNEYYVCPVYNQIVKREKVIICNADLWMTMGTPEEKEKFEIYIKKNDQ